MWPKFEFSLEKKILSLINDCDVFVELTIWLVKEQVSSYYLFVQFMPTYEVC